MELLAIPLKVDRAWSNLIPRAFSSFSFAPSSSNEDNHFKVLKWQNSNEFLEPFWQPWPGVSLTTILNKEKALGRGGTWSFLNSHFLVCSY